MVSDFEGLEARVVQELQRRGASFRRGEWWLLCPRHAERSPSAAFKPESRTWYCQGCGSGGGIVDLARWLGIESSGAVDAATRARLEADRLEIMARDAERRAQDAETLSEYWRGAGVVAELRRHADTMARLLSEGISRIAVDHFGIGWTTYGVDGVGLPALAIPWTVRGETRALQYRLLSEDAPGGRYRWHKGSRPTLYNADAVLTPCDDRVIVVEGAKKCMALWGTGIESVCAIPNKAGWRAEYAPPFKAFSSVVFALDPDASVEARHAANTIPGARVAHLPQKPDDLLTGTGGDVDLLMAYIDAAHRVD